MAHTALNLRERRTIEDILNAKVPVPEIAVEIGRHVSIVYRDIKRNGYTDHELPALNRYYGVVAQRAATQRRARRRKLVRLVGLRKAVIKQLKEGWSPEQIAGRLHLKVKRCASATRRSTPIFRALTVNPERAQGKMNVASLVERKTRFSVLFRNNDRSTTHLMNRLMSVMEPLPQPARKSITFDRGI
ncbi:helix-turn-helix domain-containing protein, partial [Paracoccus sp. JM45]|uniref:helix-turn-helix domain-containing protein n=1 Tax=Paracoccus sp. JM45 TaxID=2283626 RepID=UPI0021075709